jgi:pteridine reductase
MQERAVLVTGAARRIGAAIARTLHAAGRSVIVHCNRSRDDAERSPTS